MTTWDDRQTTITSTWPRCRHCNRHRDEHDPVTGRCLDHSFRSPVIECEADETKVLAQMVHEGVRSGEISVADLAKVLTIQATKVSMTAHYARSEEPQRREALERLGRAVSA